MVGETGVGFIASESVLRRFVADSKRCVAPLWAGCCREGWAGKNRSGDPLPMNVNGPAKCREFGRYLGRRYHAFANVGWILGGGAGHAYGSPNWRCEPGWREGLQRPGALSLRHWFHLFSSRPWWTLEPDRTNTVAVAGQGPFATNDYATTARASDRSFAISYLPSPRPLTLDLSQLSGRRLQAWWFNPRTGQATPAGEWKRKSREAFPRHTFMPPAEGDWALLVEDARKGYPPLSRKDSTGTSRQDAKPRRWNGA